MHLNNRNPRVNKKAFEQKSVCFNTLSKKAQPELVWFSINLSLKGIPLFMSPARFEVPVDLDITRRIDLFERPKCKILTKELSDDSMHKTRNLLAAWLIFPSLLHAMYIFFLRKAHTEILKFFIGYFSSFTQAYVVMVSYYISSCFKLYCILPLGQFLKSPEEERPSVPFEILE